MTLDKIWDLEKLRYLDFWEHENYLRLDQTGLIKFGGLKRGAVVQAATTMF